MRLEGFTDITPILRCGIYALCFHGRVVYIGKSKNLYVRIYAHRNLYYAKLKKQALSSSLVPLKAIQFDEVHILPCSPDRMDALEREMINKYNPKMNVFLFEKKKYTKEVTINVRGIPIVINGPTTVPQPAERIVRRA